MITKVLDNISKVKGEFAATEAYKTIQYKLADNQKVTIDSVYSLNGTKVLQTFGVEDEHSLERQRQGWVGIMNNLKSTLILRTINNTHC